MSGRKGDDKVASSTSKSKKDSTRAEKAEVISHREARRRLLARAQQEDKNLEFDAGLFLHRDYFSTFEKRRVSDSPGFGGRRFWSPYIPRYGHFSSAHRLPPNLAKGAMAMGGEAHREDPQIHPFFLFGEGPLQGVKFEAPRKMEQGSFFEAPRKTEVETDSFFVMLDGKQTRPPESEVPPRSMEVEKEEKKRCAMCMEEHETPELEMIGPDDQAPWMSVSEFRCYWNKRWSGHFGSFEDTTKIPPMRFTFKPMEDFDLQDDTLQIFSVKLAATRGCLELPLDVFGMVAIRDPVDHNRNIIFHRKRDDCQTLTEKDPYLVLSGPTRAVVFAYNPAIIEVDLKVKGTTESDDVCLSFLVAPLKCYSGIMCSHLFNRTYSSKLSTLEFALGQIAFSVEATIFVRVVQGSWPDGLCGLFTAFTTGFTDRCPMPVYGKESTGTGTERIILLDSRGEKLPVASDGNISFSRRVVSVEGCGEVKVQVNAFKGETKIVEIFKSFHASEAGESIGEIDVSFCKMEVAVFWSLVSYYPLGDDESLEDDCSAV
ncbi:unnamed protein product [Urochloa decumbens]|uniref:DUF6598 domain-containing protein n=1 Tax=Urochloa decumbens TaxID=240449 RepID=A0ABC9FB36_9POAL